MLLVVDDAWQLEEVLAFKVGGPNCSYLVTTRLPKVAQGFAGDGAVGIQELSEDQGLILLKKLAPIAVEAEPDSARELVQWVDGLPLALTLMGNYLRGETRGKQPRRLAAAIERLRQARERLRLAWPQGPLEHHPSLPAGVSLSLMASIDVSYHALNRDARVMLLAFSPFPAKPNTFSEAAAVAVSALPAQILDRLTDSGLVETSGPERYTLHLVISDYARLKCIRKTPYERMATFFVSFVQEHKKDYMLLDQEMGNVLIALHTAYERGLNNSLVLGIIGFTPFLQSRGLYEIAEIHLNRALQAARSIGDTAALVKSLGALGRIDLARGLYLQAEEYLQEGLTLARRIGNTEEIISLLSLEGQVAQRRGNAVNAERYYQEGLALASQIGKSESISALLNNLGTLAISRGDVVRAEEYWQEGVTLARQIGHLEYLRDLLLDLARLYEGSAQGDEYLQEAVRLALQVGDPEKISLVLNNLGSVAQKHGDLSRAGKYWQEGLALARQIDNPEQIIRLLLPLAASAKEQGNVTEAEHYYLDGLFLARQIDHPLLIMDILGGLGAIATSSGDYIQAKTYYQEGLTLARESGVDLIIIIYLLKLGLLEDKQGNIMQAESYYLELLALDRKMGESKEIMATLNRLGDLATERGDYARAEQYLKESLDLVRQMGDSEGVCKLLGDLGNLYLKQQQWDSAALTFQDAFTVSQAIKNSEMAAASLYSLAQVAVAQGNIAKAREQGQAGLRIFEAMNHEMANEVRQWLAALTKSMKGEQGQKRLH